ncbi:ATP-grasp fold amidoligase family protein [Nesterenkonia sp. K-15-9-6]|uniref:ATP-grasp fold amidoligase family protein n=1 Tax=Nesterenkonia sp. K-15-9-6 TaxID=3093918 RepID=UPI0040446219
MVRIPAAVRRRLPGIAWRDRKILQLETRVAHLEASRERVRRLLREARSSGRDELRRREEEITRLSDDLQEAILRAEAAEAEHARFRRSSFKGKLSSHMAAVNAAKLSGWQATTPALQLPYKLRSYALAQSHGIAVPRIHQVWSRTEDIRIPDDLPADRVVLKADGGHSGLGVVPLRRTAEGWQTLTGRDTLVDGRPGDRLLSRLERARGPFFLESFLEPFAEPFAQPFATTDSRAGADHGAAGQGSADLALVGPPQGAEVRLPEDIKVYTAYGEIMQVLVMRTHGVKVMNRSRFTRRYFDAEARPLGEVLPGRPEDPEITAPEGWEDLMEAARRLSIAVGLPFVRVDLYSTPDGPVLGELTPMPGGVQEYRLNHDLRLGAAWMRADLRLARDLARGRPSGTLFGSEPYQWWYPEPRGGEPAGTEGGPSRWPRLQADPLQWYTPPEDVVRLGTDGNGADQTGADQTGADQTGADQTGADQTGAEGATAEVSIPEESRPDDRGPDEDQVELRIADSSR